MCFSLFGAVQVAVAKDIEGWLHTVYGDARVGDSGSRLVAYLTDDQNRRYELLVTESAAVSLRSLQANSGKGVSVSVVSAPKMDGLVSSDSSLYINNMVVRAPALDSAAMRQREASSAAAPASKRYVSLLCKFSDVAAEDQPLSYFDAMYDDAPGQLGVGFFGENNQPRCHGLYGRGILRWQVHRAAGTVAFAGRG